MSSAEILAIPPDSVGRKRPNDQQDDIDHLGRAKRLQRSAGTRRGSTGLTNGEKDPKFTIPAAAIEGGDRQLPEKQSALLLYQKRSPYVLKTGQPLPQVKHLDEVLVKILAIGLNPIDWKAADYGFGIPALPYIAGRDLVGLVVSNSPDPKTDGTTQKIKCGDLVISASTDYRDLRKAAFQEYAVASRSNLCHLTVPGVNITKYAGLGVAFVAAAIALGVCFGCDFSKLNHKIRGPNMRHMLRSMKSDRFARDIREQCLELAQSDDVPQRGDWLAIWGGSSATAMIVSQLAKQLGLHVIKVVDVEKHGNELSDGHSDLLVDSENSDRAVKIVKAVTSGKLRYGIDTVGKETATLLQRTLKTGSGRGLSKQRRQSHLVGLTGLPKEVEAGVQHHTVPIKLHHEIEEVGQALMSWLERLIAADAITPPRVEVVSGGLDRINASLDRMRCGEIAGRRLVVDLGATT